MEKVWKSWILVYLIGGFNPSEKNISQLGLFFPIITWKVIKFMFQTTNQLPSNQAWLENRKLLYKWTLYRWKNRRCSLG
jgi:hypothetical protein